MKSLRDREYIFIFLRLFLWIRHIIHLLPEGMLYIMEKYEEIAELIYQKMGYHVNWGT